MTTERGCLETATLQLWNLQKYKQRKRWMDGDRHLSFQRKPTVLLSERWEKVDKAVYLALVTLPSKTFNLTRPLLPQQDVSLLLSSLPVPGWAPPSHLVVPISLDWLQKKSIHRDMTPDVYIVKFTRRDATLRSIFSILVLFNCPKILTQKCLGNFVLIAFHANDYHSAVLKNRRNSCMSTWKGKCPNGIPSIKM